MRELLREWLRSIGEDPDREGLRKTPERLRETWAFLTSGYKDRIEDILTAGISTDICDEMVLLKDIEVLSVCEHHFLPFYGRCHIAYLPDTMMVGLGRLARLVDALSRRLQIQERLTIQIAEAIQAHLKPKGVGVVIEARHLCMALKGVEKQHCRAVTSSMLGCFRSRQETRMEFLNLVGLK
ncbi:MAG: GTP cyclohydrolase I FolE [Candidatus Aureabacteria bacterium]|nr:GTP cyclohydrolase I FolE [Candidatus Auribacterota bacterium]